MDIAQKQVTEFHRAFGHPVGENGPQLLTLERARARAEWMREEIDEFLEATEEGRVDKAADAMADLRYFAIGTDVEMGVDGQPVFDLVQAANMAKLHDVDGVPTAVFRDDGKVVKPEGWTAPDEQIAQELETQVRLAFVNNLAIELSKRDPSLALSHAVAADFARLSVDEARDALEKAGRLRRARLHSQPSRRLLPVPIGDTGLLVVDWLNDPEADDEVLVADAGLGGSDLGSTERA